MKKAMIKIRYHSTARNFDKYLKFAKQKKGRRNVPKNQVVCYECNKPGHYKSERPTLIKKDKEEEQEKKKKKKTLQATWMIVKIAQTRRKPIFAL